MYGAVLWCDPQNEKALIWCEDHADLAFYNAPLNDTQTELALEAGDLVRFDVTELRAMRVAENLEIVAADEYPTLAQTLRTADSPAVNGPVLSRSVSESTIIPFPEAANATRTPRLPMVPTKEAVKSANGQS